MVGTVLPTPRGRQGSDVTLDVANGTSTSAMMFPADVVEALRYAAETVRERRLPLRPSA
jgi:hypothetical protein